jgi:hypothetical protein
MKKITLGRVKNYPNRKLLVYNPVSKSAFKCSYLNGDKDIVRVKVISIYSNPNDMLWKSNNNKNNPILLGSDKIYLLDKSEEPEYRINEILLAIKL